ncbi:MAG: nucleotidyl transferase AbiEii/AbiGii toxin family protein [Nitrosotalea sp.]
MKGDEIKILAGKHGVPAGTLEKDFTITIILSIISRFGEIDKLVFKGGTSLKKAYFAETRFSEDLDFTCTEDISSSLYGFLIKGITNNQVDFTEVKEEKTVAQSKSFSVKYNDFNGHPNSVKIDLSIREKVLNGQENRQIIHFYDNMKPSVFHIPTMTLKEIIAEKVRAIIYAQRPRHLYDMWYLLGKNVVIDPSLVNSKLSLYGDQFDLKKLKEGMNKTKKNWKADLRHLMPNMPSFDDVAENVLIKISEVMK